MNVSAGTRLGPYEIVAPLGAGGMGEVYRARDTRLDRTVAIKVLPPLLAADPQLRERFEREARAISALNHPHICTLFDRGRQDGVDFLVLEYLEGETIADRLARGGALAPAEALTIAVDVCDALDKAHRSGIIHRDLKPANVMLTKSGAKLVDFGLAKSVAPVVAASGGSMLPTTPPNLTAQGAILGTFQYMAPEQIEGLEADARTDIFAFGALLFEMLTGRTAFAGPTRAQLLGSILKDEPPPVSRLQPLASEPLDRLVRTCLAKDPDDRYQNARDLWRDLRWVMSNAGETAATAPGAPTATSSRIAWLIAGVSAIALVGVAGLALRRNEPPAPDRVEFTIMPPEDATFGGPPGGGTGDATQMAVSPDGKHIVFVAGAPSAYRIWLRPLAGQTATPIVGTEGGTFPFWSPDSQSIGFFADGKLKKVQIHGGPPVIVCDALGGRGGTWNRDNVIVFASTFGQSGLRRVSSGGGTPTAATTLDPNAAGTNHRWPHFLPDGRHFIFTEITGTCCPASTPAVIRVGSLDSTDTVALMQVESSISYAQGHLFFSRDGTLMAQPFDADARQLKGDAFPVADNVGPEGSRYVSASASQNGALVFTRLVERNQRLIWFDRTGRAVSTVGETRTIGAISGGARLSLSFDDTRVAFVDATGVPENLDVWIIDLARGAARSRLTSDLDADRSPVWSPDGSRIAFIARRSEKFGIRQKLVNSTAPEESLLELEQSLAPFPTDWSTDGRFIAYTLSGTFPQRSDVWVLPLFGDRKPFAVAETQFAEMTAAFAPNGRWIAYVSNEAGALNVYVRPFPAGGEKYAVSTNGGVQPFWRADGKELFFLTPEGTLMAVPIGGSERIEIGTPVALFDAISPRNLNFDTRQFVATRDGQRFLVHRRPPQSAVTPITVVLNWSAPAGR